MRILLVTDGLHPFVLGGMQKHSFYLAQFLARKGVQVHVVHCAPKEVAGHELERPEFTGFDPRFASFTVVPFPVEDRWPGHYLRANKRYSANVLAAVQDHMQGVDLIYCQGFTGSAFVEVRNQGLLDVPVVVNLHGYEMFQTPPSLLSKVSRGPLRQTAKHISRNADAVFSFGGHITDILLGMGVPQARILECSIGIGKSWLVDKAALPANGERNFIFVGRDERRKGVKELTAAIKALFHAGETGFRVHFVGPVQAENKLDDARVVYHGAVREEEKIKQLLRASDVLLCPSWSEGMPTVIMEAMASGLAVIATDVGAISQQVGDNGWLLATPDPQAIAHAMLAALHTPPQELVAMKQRSLEKVRGQFTWEQVIERKLALMASLPSAVKAHQPA